MANGKIFRGIVNIAEDKKLLWREPENLEDWHNRNRMKFSGAKYKVMYLGSKDKIILFQRLMAH